MKGLEDQLLGRVILTEKAVSCLSIELEFSLFLSILHFRLRYFGKKT